MACELGFGVRVGLLTSEASGFSVTVRVTSGRTDVRVASFGVASFPGAGFREGSNVPNSGTRGCVVETPADAG